MIFSDYLMKQGASRYFSTSPIFFSEKLTHNNDNDNNNNPIDENNNNSPQPKKKTQTERCEIFYKKIKIVLNYIKQKKKN